MIVLTCSAFFIFSLVFGRSRGVLVRSLRRRRVNQSIEMQHLLRAMYELLEGSGNDKLDDGVILQELQPMRSWSPRQLERVVLRAQYLELVVKLGKQLRLTRRGLIEAERLTREHRLWELYLITHADIAPSRVDREADHIEHVLEPEVVAELEAMLTGEARAIPKSPHEMESAGRVPSNSDADADAGSDTATGVAT